MSAKNPTRPGICLYPDRVGVLFFKDGTSQVDALSPDIPPNVVYVREDSLKPAGDKAEALYDLRNAAAEGFSGDASVTPSDLLKPATIATLEAALTSTAEKELRDALKMCCDVMKAAEALIGSTGLHDKWHEQGKDHRAFHDLLFKRIDAQKILTRYQ